MTPMSSTFLNQLAMGVKELCLALFQKTLGTEIADRIVRNGDELFDDQELDIISPHQPKKMLGMWI